MENSPRYWLLLECLPVYLLPVIGVFFLALFGPHDWDLAIAQAVTGTDFFAGSFAFLYVVMFKKQLTFDLKVQVLVALVIMGGLFLGVKLVPISIPVNNVCCEDYKNSRVWLYVMFSLASFFWTYSLVKKSNNVAL